jgi:protein-disulfide isomerase
MPISRRHLLVLAGATGMPGAAWAADPDPNSPFAQRSIGSPKAPVTAIEYFSLTCTHCAHFGTVLMPQIKPNLVDTGKLQIIYKDFPLDSVALMAAQVARSLPAAQYYPFIEALFASQDDWAFAPGIDYKAALYKYAALAGMDRATYDAALANDRLKSFILDGQRYAEQVYNVQGTPTFILNGRVVDGDGFDYDEFTAMVAKAAQA